jgi:hypothetical protein
MIEYQQNLMVLDIEESDIKCLALADLSLAPAHGTARSVGFRRSRLCTSS